MGGFVLVVALNVVKACKKTLHLMQLAKYRRQRPQDKTSYVTKGYLSSTGNKLEVHTQSLLLLLLHVIYCVTACAEKVYT